MTRRPSPAALALDASIKRLRLALDTPDEARALKAHAALVATLHDPAASRGLTDSPCNCRHRAAKGS